MATWGHKFYLRAETFSHSFASLTLERVTALEDKICFPAWPSNILYLITTLFNIWLYNIYYILLEKSGKMFNQIDPLQKWLPLNYSFVHI